MIVRSRAPLRLGLGGGGTDVAPFCDKYGGFVLNATVDLYAYTTIEPSDDGRVHIRAADRGDSIDFEAGTDFAPAGPLQLQIGVYHRIARQYGQGKPLPLRITTYADVPAGSGLGSSSTLVVAMLKAYSELLGLPLGEYETARLAYEIERVDLAMNGGKQDQYAATFGGFNFMEFYADDKVIVNPLRVKQWIISELESSLVLFYTGVSRVSADIIDEQSRRFREQDSMSIAAANELKTSAIAMKEALLVGDLSRFAQCLDSSWSAKKRTAGKVSSAEIDETYRAAKESGALAGKVSGAGGGGFMMFLVEPTQRTEVVRVLDERPGRVINCHFTKHGTEGWKVF